MLSDTLDIARRADEAARRERLASPEIIQSARAVRHAAVGSALRHAFVKTTPGATTVVTCYLDTDLTGEEISVKCKICNGGESLEDAYPTLVAGDPITVWHDGTDWWCLNNFQNNVECSCVI